MCSQVAKDYPSLRNMNPIPVLFLALAAVETAFGCSCYDSRSLEQKLRDAKLVLVGKVLSQEPEKKLSEYGYPMGRIAYTVQNHVFKMPNNSIDFQKANGIGRVYAQSESSMCGLRLTTNATYLLAVYVGEDGRGEVMSCGGVYRELHRLSATLLQSLVTGSLFADSKQ